MSSDSDDFGSKQTMKFVLRYLDKKGMKILDVGCGRGELSLLLRQNGYDVIGIDNSSEAIEFARFQNVPLLQQSFESFELPKAKGQQEKFDVILFSRSLHHIHSLENSIQKANALLKKNGLLILEEFGLERMDEKTAQWFYQTQELLLLFGFISKKERNPHPPRKKTNHYFDQNYLARWNQEHTHEHLLHSSQEMLDTVRKYFLVQRKQTAPYLYRYFSESNFFLPRNTKTEIGKENMLNKLFQWEKSLIQQRKITAIGIRIVGSPKDKV